MDEIYEQQKADWLESMSEHYEAMEQLKAYAHISTKGDAMKYCKQYDLRIKEIDSAIPSDLSNRFRELGLCTESLAMCYWKNGTIEPLNVIEHAFKLNLGV